MNLFSFNRLLFFVFFFFPPGGNGAVGLQPTGGAFTPGEDQVGRFQEFPVHLGPLLLNQHI